MSERIHYCQCRCGLPGCVVRQARYRRGLDPLHGTKSNYDAGCRCEECSTANTAATIQQRSRANAATREKASRNGQAWTSAELELATDDAYTAREAALLLGRTMQAVKNIRGKCRTDPRFIELLGSRSQA